MRRVLTIAALAGALLAGCGESPDTGPTIIATFVVPPPPTAPPRAASVPVVDIPATATRVAESRLNATRPVPTPTPAATAIGSAAATAGPIGIPTFAATVRIPNIPATATRVAELRPTATRADPAPAATATIPAPSFRPTDRIGAAVPVNLRSGPGTNYAPLDTLPPGTLLEATGESASAGGFLWRRFRLEDGRLGWVRQADVLPVP